MVSRWNLGIHMELMESIYMGFYSPPFFFIQHMCPTHLAIFHGEFHFWTQLLPSIWGLHLLRPFLCLPVFSSPGLRLQFGVEKLGILLRKRRDRGKRERRNLAKGNTVPVVCSFYFLIEGKFGSPIGTNAIEILTLSRNSNHQSLQA